MSNHYNYFTEISLQAIQHPLYTVGSDSHYVFNVVESTAFTSVHPQEKTGRRFLHVSAGNGGRLSQREAASEKDTSSRNGYRRAKTNGLCETT